jgi:hypothetical protein
VEFVQQVMPWQVTVSSPGFVYEKTSGAVCAPFFAGDGYVESVAWNLPPVSNLNFVANREITTTPTISFQGQCLTQATATARKFDFTDVVSPWNAKTSEGDWLP